MVFSFISLLLIFFFLLGFSIFLFLHAKKLKTTATLSTNIIQKNRIFGFLGLIFLLISFTLASFILPSTAYVNHLRGQYYFSKFLDSGTTEQARKAFRLWQHDGDRAAFQKALPDIPQGSEVWKDFFHSISLLNLEKKDLATYFQFFNSFEPKLTHPVALSAFNFEIGIAYLNVDPIRASKHFQLVLDMKNDHESIDRA
jgi:hypothetical protein